MVFGVQKGITGMGDIIATCLGDRLASALAAGSQGSVVRYP
jgi:hypothetical protein